MSEGAPVNVASGERAEKDLDAFIERRDTERRKGEGERRAEELWEESVRRHQRRTGEARRLELLAWHEGQAARLTSTLGALVRYHEAEAERYRANGHHHEEESA